MFSATNSNVANAVALPAENKLDLSLPGMVSALQNTSTGITIHQLADDDIPVFNLASFINFRELKEDNANKFSHDVRLAEDKQSVTWIVKRTMKNKVRELKRDKEKEKTAREVFLQRQQDF